MVQESRRQAKVPNGRRRRILANFHSATGLWDFGLWRDFVEAYNCLAVIDEAHMWFSARSWTKTQQLELSIFQQHRKEGLDLWWIAQHENRVDVAIREVTAFIWRVRRFGRYVVASKRTPDDMKHVLSRKVWVLTPAVFQHYFTEERIGDREGNGYGLGRGAAYARSVDAAPILGESMQLRPNRYRVEFPTTVRYFRGSESDAVASALFQAYAQWRDCGAPKSFGRLLSAFYRSPEGRLYEIDQDKLLARPEEKGIIEMARAAFRATIPNKERPTFTWP